MTFENIEEYEENKGKDSVANKHPSTLINTVAPY